MSTKITYRIMGQTDETIEVEEEDAAHAVCELGKVLLARVKGYGVVAKAVFESES